MKKDLIFVFFGGTMNGVFGAGAATSIQKLNLYDRIYSVYGISAGAHDSAYLLAKDTKIGSSIYYENLINNLFIKKNKLSFLITLLLNTINKRFKIKEIVDMDYLIDIEKNTKVLNVEKISKSDINFYIRCFNISEQKEEYLNGKVDTFNRLLASSAVIPFYTKLIKINGKLYSDGDTLSKILDPELEKMIRDNKDKKIFFVLNYKLKIKYIIVNFFWTLLLMLYIKKPFVFKKLEITSEIKKLKRYSKLPNIYIIEPDMNFHPLFTDKQNVVRLYKNGIKKTKIQLEKITNLNND